MELKNSCRKRKLKSLTLIFLLVPTVIKAHTFYLNNYTARATALGESYLSIGGDSDIIFFNPAELVNIKNNSLQYTMADLFGLDIALDTLTYALPLKESGFGLGYSIISSGEQPITDVYRYPEYGGQTGEGIVMSSQDEPVIFGYFSESKTAFYISYGRYVYNNIAVGISVKRYAYFYDGDDVGDKYINSLLNTKANCWSIDFGFYWQIRQNIAIAAAIWDLVNTGFRWNTETPYIMKLDKQVSLGASCNFIKNLLTSINATKIMDTEPIQLKAGIEYRLMGFLPLRVGLNNKIINFGSGLILESNKVLRYIFEKMPPGLDKRYLKFDYALILNSELGNTHKFTVSLEF